jgi:hypothetical protein
MTAHGEAHDTDLSSDVCNRAHERPVIAHRSELKIRTSVIGNMDRRVSGAITSYGLSEPLFAAAVSAAQALVVGTSSVSH